MCQLIMFLIGLEWVQQGAGACSWTSMFEMVSSRLNLGQLKNHSKLIPLDVLWIQKMQLHQNLKSFTRSAKGALARWLDLPHEFAHSGAATALWIQKLGRAKSLFAFQNRNFCLATPNK